MKCLFVILLFVGQCIVCSWQVQIRCSVVRLNNGKVRLRARGRIIKFSCLDGYTLVGNKYSTCIRGQWDTPTPVCVNSECPIPPTPAHAFVASKVDGAILLYFCEPGYSLIGTAEIYCNGHQWNGTTPYCRDANASAPTKCDFESPDLCWWEQDPQHDFDWKRHNFETPSLHIGTGPTHDHTLGAGNDGHYLYIEASGRLVNDTARIISPLYNSSLTESGCFSFWYHMYGATIGMLNIYFRQEIDTTSRLMFSKSGNQGNQWYHGTFELPKANISFQIIIEGVRGSSYVSDIAIDDVAILQGDECILKNESTSVTVGDEDQIEIVNAQQTCRNRCVYSLMVTTIAYNALYGPENCYCTLDCMERSICCPDYAEYCILGFTFGGFTNIPMESTIPTKLTTIITTSKTIPSNKNNDTDNKSTITSTRNPTLTRFPINPKDGIDPGNSLSMNSSSTTTQKLTPTTTRPIKCTTKKCMLQTTVSAEQTQRMETKETPFLPLTTKTLTTKYIEHHDRSELHSVGQTSEKVKHGDPLRKSDRSYEGLIIAAIGAILGVLFLATVTAIIVIRRKKNYKRGGSSSALCEDSDVRFLTSDEILDFNLARPVENDEL